MKKDRAYGCHMWSKTAYPSGAPEFTLGCGVHVARSLLLGVVFCRSLFVLFLLSVLQFKTSDLPFGVFKLFLNHL